MSNKFKQAVIGFFVVASTLVFSASCTVNKSDDYIRSAVVKISSKHGQCTGTEIKASSGKEYVLSAGHCNPIVIDGKVTITTEAGDKYEREVIAEDPSSDLMLFEAVGGIPTLEIAANDHRFQHMRIFSHGHGFPTYETEGKIVSMEERGEFGLFEISSEEDAKRCVGSKYEIVDGMFGSICALNVVETVTTAMTVPGSSGGAALDDDGKIIGVLTGGDDHFSMFVTLRNIQDFLRKY